MLFRAGATDGTLELRVTAPLVLHNALPMPVHAIAYGLSNWMNIRCDVVSAIDELRTPSFPSTAHLARLASVRSCTQ